MPAHCALGCEKRGVHKFPNALKFQEKFKTWVHIIGGTPQDYLTFQNKRLCDAHFTRKDYNRNNRLKALAVPSQHLPENRLKCSPVEKSISIDSELNRTQKEICLPRATWEGEGVDNNDPRRGVRMAIVPLNHPDQKFETKHFSPIWLLIVEALEGALHPTPRITVGSILGGALQVTCEGAKAIKCVLRINGKTVGEDKLQLKVTQADALPELVVVLWRSTTITGIELTQELMMVRRINPFLHTEKWQVVRSLAKGDTTQRIVVMDRVSAEGIQSASYNLYTGLGFSHFEILKDLANISFELKSAGMKKIIKNIASSECIETAGFTLTAGVSFEIQEDLMEDASKVKAETEINTEHPKSSRKTKHPNQDKFNNQ